MIESFQHSDVQWHWHDGIWNDQCEVVFRGSEIALSYKWEGRPLSYRGTEVAPGHYKLKAEGFTGSATLHRIPDDDIIQGWLMQDGVAGMCRIHLSNEKD